MNRPSVAELNRPRTDTEVAADLLVTMLHTRWLKVPNVMRLRELASDAGVPMIEIRRAFIRRDQGVTVARYGTPVEDTATVARFVIVEQEAAEIIDMATRQARPVPPTIAEIMAARLDRTLTAHQFPRPDPPATKGS